MANIRTACIAVGFWFHAGYTEYKANSESLQLNKLILRHTRGIQHNIRNNSHVFKLSKYVHVLFAPYRTIVIESILVMTTDIPKCFTSWLSRIYDSGIAFDARHTQVDNRMYCVMHMHCLGYNNQEVILSVLTTHFHTCGCSVLIRYKK